MEYVVVGILFACIFTYARVMRARDEQRQQAADNLNRVLESLETAIEKSGGKVISTEIEWED